MDVLNAYVATGQARFVFWHNLDGSRRATDLHVAAECMGRQDPALFWEAHEYIYSNQRDLFGVERADLTALAAAVGADVTAFDACVDDGSGLAAASAVDDITKARGIRSRPIFDINGAQIFGSQPFEVYAQAIEAALGQ